jgi:hypothetical protein
MVLGQLHLMIAWLQRRIARAWRVVTMASPARPDVPPAEGAAVHLSAPVCAVHDADTDREGVRAGLRD